MEQLEIDRYVRFRDEVKRATPLTTDEGVEGAGARAQADRSGYDFLEGEIKTLQRQLAINKHVSSPLVAGFVNRYLQARILRGTRALDTLRENMVKMGEEVGGRQKGGGGKKAKKGARGRGAHRRHFLKKPVRQIGHF